MLAEWSMEWNGEWSIFGLFASVFAILLFARQFLYHWLQVGALSHKLKATRSFNVNVAVRYSRDAGSSF